MRKTSVGLLGLGFLLAALPLFAQSNACDINSDGAINVVDVQLTTNMYLQAAPCTANIAGAGVCTPEVVQTVVNAALGGACSLHYVTLNWGASSSSSIAGYNIYRSTSINGPYLKLNSSLISVLTFTDTTAQAGQSYYYVSTAVNTSNIESSYSPQASAVVPTP